MQRCLKFALSLTGEHVLGVEQDISAMQHTSSNRL